jgi:diacylglycerol O-acyltransferase
MGMIAPQDAAFLIGESREHPMHVGSLQLFEPPPGAGENYISELYQHLLSFTELRPLLRRRPRNPVSSLGQLWWADDDDVDLEYHVRLTALPKPRKVRQLLELTSRLHGGLLDRHRPLWELYLIEGLDDGRFAMYTKVHHALVDGVSATRLLVSSLSADPDGECRPFWAARPASPKAPEPSASGMGALLGPLKSTAGAVREIAGVAPTLARLSVGALRGEIDGVGVPAPKTMLNVPITGARRFAAQAWDIDRIKKAGKVAGATLNDVVLAMCAGALRRYLLEQDALPDKPLAAAVPVSLALRSGTTGGDGGNAVSGVLCNLATDIADPYRRLEVISSSMRTAKEAMDGRSNAQLQAQALLLVGGPPVLATIPGALEVISPLYNLVISNVPGPRQPLYFNGARLDGSFPVSIPADGLAVNITVFSYAGSLHFGITGCRRQVPHLQRLLGHLEDSLAELEG